MDLNKYKLNKQGYWIEIETRQPFHRIVYFSKHRDKDRKLHIHHINGIKTDNRIENLIGLKEEEHTSLHTRFPMHSLPSRELIEKWLKNRRQKKKTKRNKKRARVFRCPVSGKWYPKLSKERIAKLEQQIKRDEQIAQKYAVHPTFKELLAKFKKKEFTPKTVIRRLYPTLEAESAFVAARWRLWESKP